MWFIVSPFYPKVPILEDDKTGPNFIKCILSALVAQNLAMQEMQVQSLGCEDPLEKDMVIHSNILAWKIPQTEEPGGL